MSERRKYSNKRQIINYNSLATKFGQETLLCIDRGVLAIARYLLVERGLWPTTYAVDFFDNYYLLPDTTQLATIESHIAEFLERTNDDMALCDEIVTQLDRMTTAITSAGGSCTDCGSYDAGATEPLPSTENTGEPGNHTGDPPVEFNTWAEYDTYKCEVANWIVSNQQTDVTFFATGDIAAMAVTVFAALLVSPVPGARVIALLAAVIGILGISLGILTTWGNVLANNYDELVCALYEAPDAEGAYTTFLAIFDAGVDAETSDSLFRYLIKEAEALLFSYAAVNKLFEADLFTDFGTPSNNCSTCSAECSPFVITVGSLASGSPDFPNPDFTAQSVLVTTIFTRQQISILMPIDCDVQVTVDETGYTPISHQGVYFFAWLCGDTSGAKTVPWPGDGTYHLQRNRTLSIYSSTSFTVRVFSVTNTDCP